MQLRLVSPHAPVGTRPVTCSEPQVVSCTSMATWNTLYPISRPYCQWHCLLSAHGELTDHRSWSWHYELLPKIESASLLTMISGTPTCLLGLKTLGKYQTKMAPWQSTMVVGTFGSWVILSYIGRYCFESFFSAFSFWLKHLSPRELQYLITFHGAQTFQASVP